MSEVQHTSKQLTILNKFHTRLQKERDINNKSSLYYGRLDQYFVIPGIIITGLSSVISFLATSDILDATEKQAFSVIVGVFTAIATIIQSLSSSFGFQVKKDTFQSSADTYDSIITKIEFEICNPNEDFMEFCNSLEEEILKIKNNCKFLPPLHLNPVLQKETLQLEVVSVNQTVL
jgi:hypothetical protein